MIETTIICDKCKAKKGYKDVRLLNLVVYSINEKGEGARNYGETHFGGHFCFECLKSIGGIRYWCPQEQKQIQETATLEDMIREIVNNVLDDKGIGTD